MLVTKGSLAKNVKTYVYFIIFEAILCTLSEVELKIWVLPQVLKETFKGLWLLIYSDNYKAGLVNTTLNHVGY